MNPYAPTPLLVGALGIAALLAMTACVSTDTPGAAQTSAPAEAQGGEGVPVPYSDSRFHYRIDAPGPMTANADGTASYIGPSERLQIAVVNGSQAADPLATANNDLSALSASTPGFRKIASPTAVTINGRKVVRFAYLWNAGISVVTGKAIDLTTVRYYIPKDNTTVAVLSYGIVSNLFDPQGADDLEMTFQWQ